ncbi:MATE family efflux transporter [Oceanimonas pelagia]|uniref:MATE family efflux transporter n=1 Tax=Oceanimonas pelagia TaxID=3028314 RepID=A0AA50KMQ6_9GAMM|nr:MATE family efflux transporter [Oceanimonas pelagia]WMC09933.1 MATE family efflux transporter [Oceanimonas pelagia]
MSHTNSLLTAPIGPQLARMTGPMALGIVAILAFNLVDTFFIGLLGTAPLAAVTFTFPVTFVVTSLAMGLGAGLSACLGQALGAGRHHEAARFTSHSLLLALVLVLVLAGLGLASLDPLFTLLGAEPALMPLIHDYMTIWYAASPMLVLPMVSNAAIRATGDTRTPGLVMLVAGLVNGVLDPLLIFGLGPLPALGIRGAAMSSACSWLIAMVVALYLLRHRERLLSWHWPALTTLLQHWRQLLQVAIPASFTSVLNPVATALLMLLLADFGTETVAAFGAASRIEALVLIVMMALSSVLAPFVSQNTGAGLHRRSRQGLLLAMRFALLFQLGVFALLWWLAPWLARQFTDSAEVGALLQQYLRLVPISYGLQGCFMLLGAALNGLRVSVISLLLNGVRLFGMLLPLAWLGAGLAGAKGIFTGILLANLLAGLVACLFAWRRFPWGIRHPLS